ncbi:MAG: DUF1800 domain-containing protein [Candidatus Kapabacteria bacterium]|nr:DUF1800 domain-containing protein [Candidatus Kapabacteria bacterium]
MNRRSFFSMLTHGSTFRTENDTGGNRTQAVEGLDQHTTPLTRAEAFHLLRRITFAPTLPLINQIVGKTASEALEIILGTGNEPAPTSPGTWVDQAQENPAGVDIVTKGSIESTWKSNFAKLQNWWIEQMRTEQFPAQEKLTLFWSGHFTSEFTFDLGYIPPQLLYRQNLLLRKNRIGDFRQFLEDVTLDAAMLVYLGGNLNEKGKPNENYGREMMELFSCGISWYTEGDVKEAARVLTGWKASQFSDDVAKNGLFNAYFEPSKHDVGAKQFMGQTIAGRDDTINTEFLVRTEEIRGIINILFNERANPIGNFMMRKLYRYFVYSNPGTSDVTIIEALRESFKNNQFQIRPVVKELLTSKHFFDKANIGVQIKTPAEFVVGLARQLNIPLTTGAASMALMEQTLIDPPNVAGWDGYRTWISTKTFPQRITFANAVIKTLTDAQATAFVKQFDTYTDINKFVSGLTEYFLPVAVGQARLDYYKKILLSNGPDYEWANIIANAATLNTRLQATLRALAKAPDFHLC